MVYEAAVIGTGPDPDDPDRTGYAMGYRHGGAYDRLSEVDLVACADVVRENGEAFAEEFGLDASRVYEDYERMLADLDVDVVSVCTPPSTHADIVTGCAESGTPRAIHCEKPMATTWGDCRRMVDACEASGVQLTVNHQRRFGAPFLEAKEILDDDTVGSLERIEWGEVNLFDAGVHSFDLCGYFTEGVRPAWVLAGVDYSEENLWFGTHNENQGIVQWQYENGVTGLAMTGEGERLGMDDVGCYLRLRGSDGTVEIGLEDGPDLRYRVDGAGWTTVDTDDSIHGPRSGLARAALGTVFDRAPVGDGSRFERPSFHERGIADVVDALREDRDPVCRAENSLRATELSFAAWESVRSRGRVDLPLEVEDNPLEAMVEAGVFDLSTEPGRAPVGADSR